MRNSKLIPCLLIWAISVLYADRIRADVGCGPHPFMGPCFEKQAGYSIELKGYVTQTPWVGIRVEEGGDGISAKCQDSSLMLRQNVTTGEVVSIPRLYSGESETSSGDSEPKYADPCVPPGTYRYGCQKPMQCKDETNGPVPYFKGYIVDYNEHTIDFKLCRYATDLDPAEPYDGPVPWEGIPDNTVCIGTCTRVEEQDAAAALREIRSVLSANAIIALIGLVFFVHRRYRK